jgi:hypothetical protein
MMGPSKINMVPMTQSYWRIKEIIHPSSSWDDELDDDNDADATGQHHKNRSSAMWHMPHVMSQIDPQLVTWYHILYGVPITWYSKRQNTIEKSAFGSEFVALHIAVEMNKALWYKLHMMGVPIVGPMNALCDSKSVVTNLIIP